MRRIASLICWAPWLCSAVERATWAAWFVTASLVSLLLGMLLANLFQPGANLNLPLPEELDGPAYLEALHLRALHF